MFNNMTKYLVENKPDDYGNRKIEIIESTAKIAKQYYYYKKIEPQDEEILIKYLGITDKEEESERSPDNRFYGQ